MINVKNQFPPFLLLSIGVALFIPTFKGEFLHALEYVLHRPLDLSFWSLGIGYIGAYCCALAILLSARYFGLSKRNYSLFSVLILMMLFLYFFFKNIANVPITDDAVNFLQFAMDYKSASGVMAKTDLFFGRFGMYRFVTLHCFAWASYMLLGYVHFKYMLGSVILLLPVSFFIFSKHIKDNGSALVISIAALLFQFSFYDTLVWATGAVNGLCSLFFLMLALHSLTKNGLKWQLLSIVSAVLCVLTVPMGIFVFIAFVFYHILNKNWWSMVFCFITLLLVFVFLSQGTLVLMPTVSHGIVEYVAFCCIFLGSAFQFFYGLYLPGILGFVMLVFWLYLIFKGYHRRNFFVFGLAFFVLASSVMASFYRLDRGMQTAISNRYAFFSILLVCASLVALLDVVPERLRQRTGRMVLAGSLFYALLSGLLFYPEVPIRKQKLEQYRFDIQAGNPFQPLKPIITANTHAKVLRALDAGVWR